MAVAVSLRDLVGELQILPNEGTAYLNKVTGKIIMFTDDDVAMAEAYSEIEEELEGENEERGDEEEFAAGLTPDWKEYGSPDATSYRTLEDERRTMREHRIAFPDKHTEIYMILADENIVACFCTVRATHSGKYLDAEPTGKIVIAHEMMFNRVLDGRLCETYAMGTGPGFYEQITGKQIPEQLDNLA